MHVNFSNNTLSVRKTGVTEKKSQDKEPCPRLNHAMHATTSPRTGGGLSQPRTGGGGVDFNPPPLRSRELRNVSRSGKRRYIGRAMFYKKQMDHFLMRSKLRSQKINKGQIFPKSGYFLRNSRLSRLLCKLVKFRNSQMIALDLSYQPVPSDWRPDQKCVHQRSSKVKFTFLGKRFFINNFLTT